MRVKICGLCSPEDAALAESAGATFGGVILAPVGPRQQTAESAARIWAGAPGLARAGVFVDGSPDEVARIAVRLALQVVQLHGSEDPGDVDRIRAEGPWRIWKAVRLRTPRDLEVAVTKWLGHADGLLLDGWSAVAPGGTGTSFAWEDVAPLRSVVPPGMELIVAGGLRAENVARAIRALAPDIVDVSSGVESSPGRKSAEQVRAFVAAALATPVARNGSR